METLKEMLEKRATKRSEADKLIKLAETEKRELTDDEGKLVDSLLDEIDVLNPLIETMQRSQTRSERLERSKTNPTGGPTELPRGPEVGEDRNDPVCNPDPTKYRLLRAINQLANGSRVDGYEGEISQEIAKRTESAPNGFFMPPNLAMRAFEKGDPRAQGNGERRAFDTTAGAGAIPTILDTARFIDSLKAVPIVARMGATYLADLVGSLAIPRMATNIQTYFVGESTAPTPSNPTIDQVTLSAHTLGAWTLITRRMRKQTSLDVENMVRRNMLWFMALGLDNAALNGTATGNQPNGLLTNTAISTTAIGTNGGDATWANIVAMESAIADANAMADNMGYLTSPVGKGRMKVLPKIAGSQYSSWLWESDNTVNGYKAMASTLMPKTLTKGTGTNLTSILFGNWASLMIGLWGGIDIIVDPYSNSTSGDLKVTMLQDMDCNVQHPESFNKIVDMNRQ
jgi:HK97 family phage major capsid protein